MILSIYINNKMYFFLKIVSFFFDRLKNCLQINFCAEQREVQSSCPKNSSESRLQTEINAVP